MSKMMNNDQIQIVKDDLEYLLELSKQIGPDKSGTVLLELIDRMQNVCKRDIRILGNIK